MRYLVLLIFTLWPMTLLAQEWEEQGFFGNENAESTLRVISSTDTALFAPIIETFVRQNPTIAVEYLVTSTAELDRHVRSRPSAYDVVVSSAMDLQLKLANDGLARELSITDLPDWARWRNSLFAFTTEPATIAINKSAFADQGIPQSRQDLISALRANPEAFQGRVGTYDVRLSAAGYLFATQDARASETYWRLMEVMGSLDAKLYCCSSAMINDLIAGEIDMAYNVLGSYAQARLPEAEDLHIILPSDFPTTMMRSALVPTDAPSPEGAENFVRHLISLQTTTASGFISPLPPLDLSDAAGNRSNIALEPALMTYLDAIKRRSFLKEWESAVIQGE